MRRLPPLNSLKAFEAVVRLGGLLAAADELCVSHGAISKQLVNLEQWMGVALFDRSARRLAPTAAGRELFDAIGPALDRVADAIERIVPAQPPQALHLVVSAPPTLTLHWLVPRLTGFLRLHPDIGIRLNNRREQGGVWPVGVDLAIRRGATGDSSRRERPFMHESITPMCTPATAAAFANAQPAGPGGAGPEMQAALSILAAQTWLTADMRPGDWRRWLAHVSAPSLVSASTVSFDHTYLALEAALDGLGVAMAPRFLMEDELSAGSLVAPFPKALAPSEPYVVVHESHRDGDPAIAAFSAWLLAEGEIHEARVIGDTAFDEFS